MIPGIVAGAPAGGGPPPAGDPFWTSVKSLLNFDGAASSTTFVDATGLRSWTAYNGAHQDGAGHGVFDGADDYIDTPLSSDFNMAGDFCVEVAAAVAAFGALQMIAINQDNNPYALMQIRVNASGYVEFVHKNFGGGVNTVTSPSPVTAGATVQLAIFRAAGVMGFAVNGLAVGSTFADTGAYDFNKTWEISGFNGSSLFLSGTVSGFRVTNGAARYIPGVNFTPPSLPFPTS